MKRAIVASACLAVFVYCAAVSLLYLKQTELLYRANPAYTPPSRVGAVGAEELILTTPDGEKIRAWYSEAKPGKPTILFCHGKGGNMGNRALRWNYYVARGYGVMFFDYHGFGGSTGTPSEQNLKMDARAAYDWLRGQSIAPPDIALVGESLGTGVCTMLATQVVVNSLELEAGYSSIVDIAEDRHWWAPVRLLIHDQFDAVQEIGKIRVPLFQQHGDDDDIIPIHFGKSLFAAAPSPKTWLTVKGGHHALGPEAWQRGLDFAQAVRDKSWVSQE